MDLSNRLLEVQRLWDAAQRMDKDLHEEGISKLGARALNMFRENGVNNILVLGCGEDGDAGLFAKRSFCVMTVDFSSVGLDQTRGTEKAKSIDRCGAFLEQNIRDKLPEPISSVDAIYSNLFLCMDLQEEEIRDIMLECFQVLKPGGLKVFSVFSDHDPDCGKAAKCGEDEWMIDRGFIAHFFTEEKIRKMAGGFELMWIREYKEDETPVPGVMYEVVLMRPI